MKKLFIITLLILIISSVTTYAKTYWLYKGKYGWAKCTQTFSDSNGDGILDTVTNEYSWNFDPPFVTL